MSTLITAASERGRADGHRSEPMARPGVDYVPDGTFFSRVREPFGRENLSLRIGPLGILLEGLARAQADTLGSRFSPFVVPGDQLPLPDLTVRITRAGVPAFLALPDSGSEIYRMGRRSRDDARDFWAYEFAGTLAANRREAELALVAASGPLFDRGIENFLRPLVASYVLAHGGLLLHGAGVVRGGRAFVFFGPSGSGKTTVTHLSPADLVLSDDLTLVVPAPDGFRAAGIPF